PPRARPAPRRAPALRRLLARLDPHARNPRRREPVRRPHRRHPRPPQTPRIPRRRPRRRTLAHAPHPPARRPGHVAASSHCPSATSPLPYPRPVPDPAWLKSLAGKFLVFEGPDGSGKTTQFNRFLRACTDAGLAVCEVREPGGTGVGEKIREVLLDHAHKDMSLACEMLLYMASRAQLVQQRIRPALSRGQLVL